MNLSYLLNTRSPFTSLIQVLSYLSSRLTAESGLAVLSSPRPWIYIFALPEKFNTAVTESNLDPKVRNMAITV